MNIINFETVSLGFGGDLLLDEVNFRITEIDRIGLIGRNGMGKTSFLKLIQGSLEVDTGAISRQQGLRIAYLPQEVPNDLSGDIFSIVKSGLKGMAFDWHADEVEWQTELLVNKILSRMALNKAQDFSTLSAGLKRRVLLARGLVSQPHLLLLDEPTNHLDLPSILWLEDFLSRWEGGLVFVTHDRLFLQKLANRIVELDRGHIFDWACDYLTFVKRKDAYLLAEQAQNAVFDRKLAQEEQWIRKGIEARRTRNEGRVRALKKLREIRKERREHPDKVKLEVQAARRSGKLVLETEQVSFSYSDRKIIADFTFILQRGDKVGIVGANGSGKTTLLELLLGNRKPKTGQIRWGTNLEVVYFDQLRSQLDEEKTLYENVAQGRDFIQINGVNRNIYGYLEDFLFPKERVHAPIHVLSGGERNRLLLARLFTLPANLIVLDEPTNDLDLETVEILENMLLEFQGTLLLVSHDRAFLNNLVTSTLILNGNGEVKEFIGGFDDWRDYLQPNVRDESSPKQAKIDVAFTNRSEGQTQPRKKMNYLLKKNLTQELTELPQKIEQLEKEYQQIVQQMALSSFYNQDDQVIIETVNQLKWLEEEIPKTYQRWQEVEHLLEEE